MATKAEEEIYENGFRRIKDSFGNKESYKYFGVGVDGSPYENWVKGLSDDEVKGIAVYTGSYYQDINEYLRGVDYKGNPNGKSYDTLAKDAQTSNKAKKLLDAVNNIDTALKSGRFELQEDIITYRGSSTKFFNGLTNVNSIDDLQKFIGAKITDEGIGSSAASKRKAWSKSCLIEMKFPKGKKVNGAYVDPISSNSGEDEFLIGRNAQYRIDSIEPYTGKNTKGYKYFVKVTFLGHKEGS